MFSLDFEGTLFEEEISVKYPVSFDSPIQYVKNVQKPLIATNDTEFVQLIDGLIEVSKYLQGTSRVSTHYVQPFEQFYSLRELVDSCRAKGAVVSQKKNNYYAGNRATEEEKKLPFLRLSIDNRGFLKRRYSADGSPAEGNDTYVFPSAKEVKFIHETIYIGDAAITATFAILDNNSTYTHPILKVKAKDNHIYHLHADAHSTITLFNTWFENLYMYANKKGIAPRAANLLQLFNEDLLRYEFKLVPKVKTEDLMKDNMLDLLLFLQYAYELKLSVEEFPLENDDHHIRISSAINYVDIRCKLTDGKAIIQFPITYSLVGVIHSFDKLFSLLLESSEYNKEAYEYEPFKLDDKSISKTQGVFIFDKEKHEINLPF